jgi:predicted acetyltransferase
MTSTALARAKDTARRPGVRRGSVAGIAVAAGTAGDHPAVHQFLLSVFHEPSGTELQSQLDEPTYEPSDRLLVKHGERVAAHLRLIRREMRFGASTLPIAYVADVATLPEYRGRGYASALLAAGERKMYQEGALLGLLRTTEPEFYRRRGWIVCGRHSYSVAGCHHVLAQLRQPEPPYPRRLAAGVPPPLHLRYLRRVELAAVIRLHEQGLRQAYGPYVRTEAYWRWLVNRRGYDRVYVAIEGSPEIELDGTFSAIVGYAAARSDRIVELVTKPDRPDAAVRLLARFCSDAIEQDLCEIRVDLSPNHPLHQVLLSSGGVFRQREQERGQVFMVRVLDTARLVSALHAELQSRLRFEKPIAQRELGFVIGDQPLTLEIAPGTSGLTPKRLGRTHLRCDWPQFWQLLLGHMDVQQAASCGTLFVSNRLGLDLAGTIFPQLPLWYPPLDDLPAR